MCFIDRYALTLPNRAAATYFTFVNGNALEESTGVTRQPLAGGIRASRE